MKIGLCYDLKEAVPVSQGHPDDALEEYDSPETVDALAAVFQAAGHSVVKLGGGREFLAKVLQERVDFAFNIAEGLGGCRSREAQVPAVLEMLDIPYSGSDPQCLAVCLDKPLAKKLVAMAGVHTPRCRVVSDARELNGLVADGLPLPAFVKPAYEGSSKGIRSGSRVDSIERAVAVAEELLKLYRQPVMIEEFIAGDEVTVGMVGNRPPKIVGIMRVVPKRKDPYFVYSLEVKRDWERRVDYEVPARLEAGAIRQIESSSLAAFEVLGCRDFSRMDFRISRDGTPYFLEVNPLPGLNPRSGDLPIMAGKMGWSYQRLVSAILNAALERYPQCVRR
ncbi:MAG: D-alanine--D-alanine ligase [Dehalococcoidia bacterium]|nr:D-alanine--D-alanine ligase [Dehalococcoidia bacterium]